MTVFCHARRIFQGGLLFRVLHVVHWGVRVVLCGIVLNALPLIAVAQDAEILSQSAISILQRRCINCHGPSEQEGKLRLDSREHFLAGGERGSLLIRDEAGEVSTQSLILRSIDGSDPELAMPPEDQLTESELKRLRQWLLAGAPWPVAPEQPATFQGERKGAQDTFLQDDVWQREDHPLRRTFADERWEHWAWRARSQVTPPQPNNREWAFNAIDQFWLAHWESQAIAPAGDVDRRQWLRRLSFDLIGLPPTPQEMHDFLADTAPQAYERQVDRLLQHPGYGQHMARMWLDIVRYSDSNGFDWDEFRPHAWRYRDYVIASFQADKPFDQFIREQLAGDELVGGPPRNLEEQQALIATGYLRMGPHDNAASLFNEQDRSRDELLTDLVETTGSALLGMTLACCRCHDHKTDALLQSDYYRLRAFFAAVKFADDLPIDLAEAQADIERARAELRAKIEPLEKGADAQAEGTKQKIAELKSQMPAFTFAVLMKDNSQVPPTNILAQGDYRKPLAAVEPGFPAMWNPYAAKTESVPRVESSGRRSALANWITHPENPLTARVIVNRLWQNIFGYGLVATPNDFGVTGAMPSDLALLDWLAEELIRSGWSLRHVQRLLLSSHLYRQQAVVESAHGEGFGSLRRELKRLTAEQLRDAVLSVSGQMLSYSAGPPIWPQLPPEVLQANPAFLDDNATKTKGWYPSPPELQPVRSIYVVQKRTVPIPMLETFDLPDNSVSCGRRQQSLVAPQALSLLNGDLMETAAVALATRVSQTEEPTEQIQLLYQWTLQRSPTQTEQRACESYLENFDLVQLARVLMNLNEFMYLD